MLIIYRDIEFDLENDKDRCLHGLTTGDDEEDVYTPSDVWRFVYWTCKLSKYFSLQVQRVTQIFANPSFFVDGASSNDIEQGRIGDCWFVSALATMSTCPGLVEKFCVAVSAVHTEQTATYLNTAR